MLKAHNFKMNNTQVYNQQHTSSQSTTHRLFSMSLLSCNIKMN